MMEVVFDHLALSYKMDSCGSSHSGQYSIGSSGITNAGSISVWYPQCGHFTRWSSGSICL